MPRCATLLLATWLTLFPHLQAQTSTLDQELKRLNVHTACVIHSQEIDEEPVWSPDSRDLAINIGGKWHLLDLSEETLVQATWHDKPIAAASTQPLLKEMKQDDVKKWKKAKRSGDLEVTTRSGVKVEFVQRNLSTEIVLSRDGRKVKLWSTDMETCGALAVSPDDKFLAYICELNGVFITDVEAAMKSLE